MTEKVFVKCDENSIGVLRGMCVVDAPYDHARGGVEVDADAAALKWIAAFPADFLVVKPDTNVGAMPTATATEKVREWKLGESDIETLDDQRQRLSMERERSRQSHDVAEGIAFKATLAGMSGMSFMLMPEPHHTMRDIEHAADYLRGHRDVVELYYVRIEPEAPERVTSLDM